MDAGWAPGALQVLEPQAALVAGRQLLQEKQSDFRVWGVYLLAKLKTDALPDLLRATHDESGSVVEAAVRALGELGAAPGRILPDLERLLMNDRRVAGSAAAVIANFGVDGLPSLLRGLQAKPEAVRWACAGAFSGASQPLRAAAVPKLLGLLDLEDAPLRNVVARALGECGTDARAAVPILRSYLERRQSGFGLTAIEAIGKIGIDSEETITALEEYCDDDYAPFRAAALDALTSVASAHLELLPLFLHGIESDYWWEQCAGAKGAGEIGPPAKEAVPRITDLLKEILERKAERYMNNIDRRELYLKALANITLESDPDLRKRFGVPAEP